MPKAGLYDFTIEQGTTFVLPIRVPMDLSNWTARLQMRKKIAETTALLDLTTENGGIEIDAGALESTVTISVSAAASSAITAKRGVYDLELYGPDNGLPEIRLIKGTITIDPEVTRG